MAVALNADDYQVMSFESIKSTIDNIFHIVTNDINVYDLVRNQDLPELVQKAQEDTYKYNPNITRMMEIEEILMKSDVEIMAKMNGNGKTQAMVDNSRMSYNQVQMQVAGPMQAGRAQAGPVQANRAQAGPVQANRPQARQMHVGQAQAGSMQPRSVRNSEQSTSSSWIPDFAGEFVGLQVFTYGSLTIGTQKQAVHFTSNETVKAMKLCTEMSNGGIVTWNNVTIGDYIASNFDKVNRCFQYGNDIWTCVKMQSLEHNTVYCVLLRMKGNDYGQDNKFTTISESKAKQYIRLPYNVGNKRIQYDGEYGPLSLNPGKVENVYFTFEFKDQDRPGPQAGFRNYRFELSNVIFRRYNNLEDMVRAVKPD